jgi:hypothetical protein
MLSHSTDFDQRQQREHGHEEGDGPGGPRLMERHQPDSGFVNPNYMSCISSTSHIRWGNSVSCFTKHRITNSCLRGGGK